MLTLALSRSPFTTSGPLVKLTKWQCSIGSAQRARISVAQQMPEIPTSVSLRDGAGNISFKGTDQSFAKAVETFARKGRPPMKTDPDFKKHNQQSYRVTASELKSFVERFERLEAEKQEIAAIQKEVMAEAKSRGYDTKVLRKLIALRKRDQQDVAEEEAVLDLYKEALGMR